MQSAMPPRAATPREEYDNLIDWVKGRGGEISLSFNGEGNEGEVRLDRPQDFPETVYGDLGQRIVVLATFCIEAEMGDWREGRGATGSLRISRQGIWLDGDAREEDWSYERYVDEDGLDDMEWPGEDGPDPA
ncbi:hypothetical protein ACEUZ9_000939 [Paracoccus litorisediminis]|uniref:hypothetical protein n=1 Tax=Paracoccus litorisediminis TaxID=2006130 RepID=UPI0037318F7B